MHLSIVNRGEPFSLLTMINHGQVWKAITFLCAHSLLHDVVSSFCDVVSPLRDVISSLYDGVSPLRDVVLSLCDVVLSLCDVVSYTKK